jgi:hypothetical protein
MTATRIDTHSGGRPRGIGPALLVAGPWPRARRTPAPLRATGPVAHALNLAVFWPVDQLKHHRTGRRDPSGAG